MTWDKEAIEKFFAEWLIYAARNPGEFLTYFLLCLSPILLLSAFLSYKLYTSLEKEEKGKKRRQARIANVAKARKRKDD